MNRTAGFKIRYVKLLNKPEKNGITIMYTIAIYSLNLDF